jgi:SulP family sulfate permease
LPKKEPKWNKALDVANKNKDIIGVLDAEHEINVLTINMARMHHDIHKIRTAFGRYFVRGRFQPDGSLKFYPKDRSRGCQRRRPHMAYQSGEQAIETENFS